MAAMLTTVDNPFDYFTDFDSWYQFDCEKGYNTLNLIDRFFKGASDWSEADYNAEYDRALDTIVEFLPFYVKIQGESS